MAVWGRAPPERGVEGRAGAHEQAQLLRLRGTQHVRCYGASGDGRQPSQPGATPAQTPSCPTTTATHVDVATNTHALPL